jgi:hypothetical protein
MNNKEEILRHIINDFEAGVVRGEDAVVQLKSLTGKDIDLDYLKEYQASKSLDAFVKELATEPISDWSTIDDDRALNLIEEIFEHISDDSIFNMNSEALEKRYGKATGYIQIKYFMRTSKTQMSF